MFSFFQNKEIEDEITYKKKEEDFSDIMPIAKYFHEETGITFDKQISILTNKVTSFCRQRNIHSFGELLNKIKSDKNIKQEIIDHLTTNETYFYRETKQIFELVQLVKESNSNVNILCAPSSTGEEPYSIAIALLEAGILASRFNILGIDINSDAVAKSQDSIYGERNVRKLSPEIISKYFSIQDDKYILTRTVKSLVSFKVVNLFDSSFKTLGKFDFVFSRNMLIYFDKETKLKAKSILESKRKTDEHPVFFGHADLF